MTAGRRATETAPVRVSLYTLKRALLAPRTALMRRLERRDLDAFERAMLELHYYSRSMARFRRAMEANRELLLDVDLDAGAVVFDVGAHDGAWSEQIARRYGARVHAFEPDPSSLPLLEARVGALPGVTIHRFGLGPADQGAVLSLGGLGSTIYPADWALGTAPVQIRDVVGVMDQLGIETLDLLKLNIEGGEFDLLDRLIDANRLAGVRSLLVQFHEWHPKAYRRRRAIRRALRRSHREVWGYPWIWELWRMPR